MKLNKEKFAERLIESLKIYLPEDIAQRKMSVETMNKNNGVVLTGILIAGEKGGPVFYIDKLYDMYVNDELSVAEIVKNFSREIVNGIRTEEAILNNFNVDTLLDDKDRIKMLIHDVDIPNPRLDECETYRTRSYSVDLIASFKVVLDETEEGLACVDITKSMAEMLNITGEELYNICLENSYGKDIYLLNMEDAIFHGGQTNLYKRPELLSKQNYDSSLYVLSNSNANMGASHILNPKVAERVSEILGGSYYVLPSSIHETLILPDDGNVAEAKELERMVREVNSDLVMPEEVLSDKVFYYDEVTKCLDNAMDREKEKDFSPRL